MSGAELRMMIGLVFDIKCKATYGRMMIVHERKEGKRSSYVNGWEKNKRANSRTRGLESQISETKERR